MATMAPKSGKREVLVRIRVNKKNGEITLSPDRFLLHKHQDQVLRWVCIPEQDFSVEFANVSPFYESQFSRDHPCSGLARRNIVTDKNRFYKYTVRVGGKALDPDGGVDK